MKVRLTKIDIGYYKTNILAVNKETGYKEPVTIEKSMDRTTNWNMYPLDKGISHKRQCIILLEEAKENEEYNGYILQYTNDIDKESIQSIINFQQNPNDTITI
jgi:hypothetical protein